MDYSLKLKKLQLWAKIVHYNEKSFLIDSTNLTNYEK